MNSFLNLLMMSSRKQLSHLLSKLLKSVSDVVLEELCGEAAKIGLVRQSAIRSQFQLCSDRILDLCFSFLAGSDLTLPLIVCRRWRMACNDGNCGWPAAFQLTELI